MRRCVIEIGLMLTALAVAVAVLVSFAPVSGASGYHCPGTPGSATHSFIYLTHDGGSGPKGASSPTRAFTSFIHSGSGGLHLPLTKWTHPSKNLFVYDGIHGKIQVTTFRLNGGSYAVGQTKQTCSTF